MHKNNYAERVIDITEEEDVIVAIDSISLLSSANPTKLVFFPIRMGDIQRLPRKFIISLDLCNL